MRFAIIYNLRTLLPSPYGATFLSEEGLGVMRTYRHAVRFFHHFCRGRASAVAEQQGDPFRRKILFFHRRAGGNVCATNLPFSVA